MKRAPSKDESKKRPLARDAFGRFVSRKKRRAVVKRTVVKKPKKATKEKRVKKEKSIAKKKTKSTRPASASKRTKGAKKAVGSRVLPKTGRGLSDAKRAKVRAKKKVSARSKSAKSSREEEKRKRARRGRDAERREEKRRLAASLERRRRREELASERKKAAINEKRRERYRKVRDAKILARAFEEAKHEDFRRQKRKEHEKIAVRAEDVSVELIREKAEVVGLRDVRLNKDGKWLATAPTGVHFMAYFVLDNALGLVTVLWTRRDTLERYTPEEFEEKYLTEQLTALF